MVHMIRVSFSNYLPKKDANDCGEVDDRSEDEDRNSTSQGLHNGSETDRADRVKDSVANQNKADL